MSNLKLEQLRTNPNVRVRLKPITLRLTQLEPVFTRPIENSNGGTSFKFFSQGDILVGDSGNLRKLPIDQQGYVLSSSIGNVVYSDRLVSLKNDFQNNDLINQYVSTSTQLNTIDLQMKSSGVLVSVLDQQIGYINTQIAMVANNVNSNGASLALEQTRINALNQEVTDVNTSILDIESRISTMSSNIGVIDNALTAQQSTISGLNSQIQSLSTNITSAAQTVSSNTMYKNLLVNGDFSVWQRASYFSDSNTSLYVTADHWAHCNTHGGILTSQRSSSTVGSGIQVNTLKLSLSDNLNGFTLQNVIEDVRSVQNQTMSFSFWVRSLSVVSFNVCFYMYYGPTDTVYTQTFQSNTSWTKMSGSFLSSNLTQTTIQDPSYAIFSIEILSGDFSGFEIALCQVEAGGSATSFGYRPYPLELSLCKRYYETGYTSFTGHCTGNLGVSTTFSYNALKYNVPTLSFQITTSSGFKNKPPTIGFLNQQDAGSIKMTKDPTTGYGLFVATYASEAEIL